MSKKIKLLNTRFTSVNIIFKKTDPRVRGIVASGAGLGTFMLGVIGMPSTAMQSIGFGLMLSGAYYIANSGRGAFIVQNKSKVPVWYKPKKSSEPIKLLPGNTPFLLKPIDGLGTHHKPGKVYKVPNACTCVIEENGNVTLASGISKLINNTRPMLERAEWKDTEWIKKNPDWLKLSDKTKNIRKSDEKT